MYTFGRDSSLNDKFITCELLSISKEQLTFEALPSEEPCLKVSFLSKASTIINGNKFKSKDGTPVIEKFSEDLEIKFRDPDHVITISWVPVLLVAGVDSLVPRMKELAEKYGFSLGEDLNAMAVITTGQLSEKVRDLAQNMKVLDIKWLEELQGSNEDFLDEEFMKKYEVEVKYEDKKRPSESVESQSQRRRKRVKTVKPAFEDLFLFTPVETPLEEVAPVEQVAGEVDRASELIQVVEEPLEVPSEASVESVPAETEPLEIEPVESVTASIGSQTQKEIIPDSDTESPILEPPVKPPTKRKLTLAQMNEDDTEIKMEDPEPKKRKPNTDLIKAIQATKKEGEDRIKDLELEDIDEEDIKNRIDDLLIIETFEVRARPKPSQIDNSQKYAGRKNFKTFKKAKRSTQKEIIPLEVLPEPKYVPKYQEEEYEEAYLASQFNQISGFDPEVQQPGQFFSEGMKTNDIFVGDESQSQMLVPSNRPSPRKSQRSRPTYKDLDDDDEDDEESELPRFTFKPT